MNYFNKYIKYKQKYLLIKNNINLIGGKKRPSPSESATLYDIGTTKKGNDGNMWVIVENKNGIKRWKKISNNKIKNVKKKNNIKKTNLNVLLINPFIKKTIIPLIENYNYDSEPYFIKKNDIISISDTSISQYKVIKYKYNNNKLYLKCSFYPTLYEIKNKYILYYSYTDKNKIHFPIKIINKNLAELTLNIDLTDKKYDDFYIDIIERPSFNILFEKIQNQQVKQYLESGVIFTKISKTIVDKLEKEIEIFSKNSKKDYHPFSKSKIRDLVHPSLYPYIKNISKIKKNIDVTKPIIKKDRRANKEIKIDFWNRPYEKSKYQWLPSEFNIDINGKCKIESYINNLPESNTELYKMIEKLFEKVLPYFEKIWSYIKTNKLYNNEDINLFNSVKKYCNNDKIINVSLKNRILQIIPKIVTYELKNDELEGAWHVEGMSHENIVATAVTVIEQTNNFDAKLYFKRRFTECEGAHIHFSTGQDRPKFLNKYFESGLIPLGKISTKKCSLTVFPNSHIHKLNTKNKTTKKGKRTIVVFWLVNPDVRIISTKHIEPQQKNMKFTEANKHRIKLMEERKYHKQTFNVRDLNLCEH